MPLPELFVIGAAKSGTSTLHWCLVSHDDIVGPRDPETGRSIKEIGYFNDYFHKNKWPQGIDWYLSHYPKETGVGLDSTPNYLCDPNAIIRMKDAVPDARLIVTLRDPVFRAYSHYNHYTQSIEQSKRWDWNLPGESFDANVHSELQKPRRESFGIIGRGFYIRQLKHLLKYFPREQVHIVILERWAADPDRYLSAMLDFAGLPQQPLEKKAVHVRQYTVEELSEETAALLRETYRESNEELFEFLGETIDEWQ